MRILAEKITELRTEKGWSQTELAKRANIAQSHISYIEKDKRNKRPSFDTLVKLARALGVSVEELVE